SDTGTPQGCQPPTECQARCSLLAETKSPHFAGNSSLEERPDPDTGQAPWRDGDLSPCDQNVAEPGDVARRRLRRRHDDTQPDSLMRQAHLERRLGVRVERDLLQRGSAERSDALDVHELAGERTRRESGD